MTDTTTTATANKSAADPAPWAPQQDDGQDGQEQLPLAVPAGLVDALQDRLDEELEGTGIDTGALALDPARTAASWSNRYRPGMVL
ncbi:hypothetical protein PJ985_17925 [Streptomyces sp. ACA25]|uniref:hypothetical protein n=1 Tax=Streptomyces sp. ACA25 TaxID=3022596 RepID=UPI00230827FB|nr:hypothetical protein [Streptomyces sp. ACA25]MDB1089441.1 hypothetical protein [Streptomyces sp. ACA25]